MIIGLVLSIDQGVVRGRVHLDGDLLADLAQPVYNRPHILGQAAQGVTILDQVTLSIIMLAVEFIPAQAGAFQETEHLLGGPQLAGMGFEPVNKGVERLVGAHQALNSQGMRAHRQGQEHLGIEETVGGDAGHDRGAVDHGQPFFGA